MVLLNNAHYPNIVLPSRVTVHIQDFFNTLDLVVAAEQVDGAENEGGDDEDSDSSNAESESLDLDQPETSGVKKSPTKEQSHVIQAQEEPEAYNHGSPVQTTEEGNLSDLDLGDFLNVEYLSMLDSNEPYQTQHTLKPSVVIGTGNEPVNPTSSNHCRRSTNSLTKHSATIKSSKSS